MTQKWIHNFDFIEAQTDERMGDIVGRRKNDSMELVNKPVTSHVARMTSGLSQGSRTNITKAQIDFPFMLERQPVPVAKFRNFFFGIQ